MALDPNSPEAGHYAERLMAANFGPRTDVWAAGKRAPAGVRLPVHGAWTILNAPDADGPCNCSNHYDPLVVDDDHDVSAALFYSAVAVALVLGCTAGLASALALVKNKGKGVFLSEAAR